MLVKTIARKTLGLKNHKIDKIKETSEGIIESKSAIKKDGCYLVKIMMGNIK